VNRLRRLSLLSKLLVAAVLALWLGVRLLTPVGFMPSFTGGSLAIVECPEADGAPPPMAMHEMPGMYMAAMDMAGPGHDHDGSGFHQLCPYGQAASLLGIDPGVAVIAVLAMLAALSPIARALLAIARRQTRDRPPSQGPPLNA
jgi:hypothetical protein